MNSLAQGRIKPEKAHNPTRKRRLDPSIHWYFEVARRANYRDGAQSNASIADKRAERLSDIMADHKIGDLILIGWLAVDDDKLCAAFFCHQRKAGGRPNNQ